MRVLSGIIGLVIVTLFSTGVFAQTADLYKKALTYYVKGDYTRASEVFKEYVSEKPDAAAYYMLGYSLYKIGRHDEARKYFKQAYLIDPGFSPSKIDYSVLRRK
ncbi:MAG: tetratricopeptide repeat protein [Nitrospirae bacterium]|nr:tetratricopeptide repeat protein [Nitrospirota bacterium]